MPDTVFYRYISLKAPNNLMNKYYHIPILQAREYSSSIY